MHERFFLNYIFLRKELIFLFLIIFLSGGLAIPYRTIISVILIFFIFISKVSIIRSQFFIKFFIVVLLIFIINFIFNHKNADPRAYVIFFLHFVSALGLFSYYKISRYSFHNDFYIILKFITYYSLFGFILMLVFSKRMEIIKINETSYYHLGFLFFYIDTFFNNFSRFTGFFWEPGILQIYLNIFLFYSLYVFKNKWLTFIAVIAIIGTGSTAGYIIMTLQFGWLIFSLKKNIFFLFVILLASPILTNIILSNLNNKFQGDGISSFWSRTYDLENGITLTINNPILGIGLIDVNTYMKTSQSYKYLNLSNVEMSKYFINSKSESGNSNSLIKVAYTFGIPIFILFLRCLARQNIITTKKGLFIIILLISISVEPIGMTPLFLIFVISGLDNKKIDNTKIKVD